MDGSDFRLSLGSHAVESEKCMDNNFCSKCEIANTKQYLLSHQLKSLKKGKGTKQFNTIHHFPLYFVTSRFYSVQIMNFFTFKKKIYFRDGSPSDSIMSLRTIYFVDGRLIIFVLKSWVGYSKWRINVSWGNYFKNVPSKDFLFETYWNKNQQEFAINRESSIKLNL